MGLFRSKKPAVEPAPQESRNDAFHSEISHMSVSEALAHIKANPKKDLGAPDPRLEELNRRPFF